MSFNRLEADDFVVSADSITAGIFTDSQIPEITTFFTSSTQRLSTSGDYYRNIFSNATPIWHVLLTITPQPAFSTN